MHLTGKGLSATSDIKENGLGIVVVEKEKNRLRPKGSEPTPAKQETEAG